MELISVIVPVYKVEPYLDRCIQSIVDQTYRNLEIILVDDGSPDRCGEICDAWAAKDDRIKVIHKENGGLSDARNAGMAVATGEYIGFVDSDDYIAPDMYRLLLERITADGSDIAACGVEMVFEDGTPPRMLTPAGNHILDNAHAMEAIIREDLLKQPVWYKLYRAELIRHIPFAVGKSHEDVFWSWQAVAKARQISVFDTPCYYYLQRSGSIMGSSYSLKRLDSLEADRLRLQYIQKHYPALQTITRYHAKTACLYAMQMSVKHLPEPQKKQAMAQICKQWKDVQGPIPKVRLKQRVWMSLADISLPLTARLRNILNIGC